VLGSHGEEGNLTCLVLRLKQEIFRTISWICLQYI